MNPDGYESTEHYRASAVAAIQNWIDDLTTRLGTDRAFREWCSMISLKRGTRR